MKTSFEQNKDIIICEYIQNADILKFSFPAYLSPEELKGKIEIVARELSANSRARRSSTSMSVIATHSTLAAVITALRRRRPKTVPQQAPGQRKKDRRFGPGLYAPRVTLQFIHKLLTSYSLFLRSRNSSKIAFGLMVMSTCNLSLNIPR